jgi:hypothetical protein
MKRTSSAKTKTIDPIIYLGELNTITCRETMMICNMIHTLGVLKPVNRYELHKALP